MDRLSTEQLEAYLDTDLGKGRLVHSISRWPRLGACGGRERDECGRIAHGVARSHVSDFPTTKLIKLTPTMKLIT